MDTENRSMRVGRINYTNVLPFFHGLDLGWSGTLDLVDAYPTGVNAKLRQGDLDVAPISSLEYLNHQDDYWLLPDLAIGSRNFSGSVLLLSKLPIELLNGKTLAVTHQSLSSSILLKILMRFCYQFECHFETTSLKAREMVEEFGAGLVIGDDALFFEHDSFLYKYDLSQLWWNWTERPFCFALWAVRKEYAKNNLGDISHFYERLVENRDRNLTDIEGLIKESLGIDFLDKDYAKVFGYFFNLLYSLDSELIQGLNLYFRLAHRLGVSPKPKSIEFIKREGIASRR